MSVWEKICVMAFAVIMLFLFVFCILQENKHYCDNPYERVCVESHSRKGLVMFPVSNGKGMLFMVQIPTGYTVCDKYEKRIKEKCKR